jgi:hypothetical protein
MTTLAAIGYCMPRGATAQKSVAFSELTGRGKTKYGYPDLRYRPASRQPDSSRLRPRNEKPHSSGVPEEPLRL